MWREQLGDVPRRTSSGNIKESGETSHTEYEKRTISRMLRPLDRPYQTPRGEWSGHDAWNTEEIEFGKRNRCQKSGRKVRLSPNTIRKEPIGLGNIKGIKLLEYGMKITTRSASWSSLMLLITIVWSLPTLTWNSVSSPTNSHPEMHTPPLYEEG